MAKRKGVRQKLYDDDTMNLAVQEVRAKKLTIRRAAKKYCIPKSTLSDYVKNKQKIQKEGKCTTFTDVKQMLSASEEKLLAEWIIHQTQHGILVSKKVLREQAHKMIIDNPHRVKNSVLLERGPGIKWTSLFIARHPEIKSIMSPHKKSLASSASSFFQDLNPAETEMIEVEADPLPMLNDDMEEQGDNNLKLQKKMNSPRVYYDEDCVGLQLSGSKQEQTEKNSSQMMESQKSASNENKIIHLKKLTYQKDRKQQAPNSLDMLFNLNQRKRTAGLKKLTAAGSSFPCSVCKLRFESKSIRDFHVFYIHNFGVQLKCNLCKCVFKKTGKLNSHMKTCYLSCDHCVFKSRDKINLKYHMFMNHLGNE